MVIAIIALLMAILMPTLERVKKQAKAIACQSNLKQWGLVWDMYTDENKSKFPVNLGYNWMQRLVEYYHNSEKLLYCPMTTRTAAEGADIRYAIIADSGGKRYGSYAINEWVYDMYPGGGRSHEDYWRSINHKGLNNVTVMGDASWRCDIQPYPHDAPPGYEGEPRTGVGGQEMRVSCINRHDRAINVLFMDWSVRRIGLKELWTLKWHQNYNIHGPWTIAGGVMPSDWPEWMRSFKDY